MSQIVVRALAAGLVLALSAGCVSSPAPTPSPTPTRDARGPITFAAPGDPTGAVEGGIREWNALNPDEPVTLRELPLSSDAQRDDLATRAQDHNGEYTVMAVDVAWLPQLADAGALADLSAAGLPTDGLLRIAQDAGTYDGVLYAYPYTADAGLLYYRKDLLDALGVGPPTTWDELASVCATLKVTRPTMGCFATPDRPGEALTVSVLEAIQGAGGQAFVADGTPMFDSEQVAAGLSWLKANRASAGSSAGYDDGTLRAAFDRGELAFMRGWGEAWALIGAEPDATVRPDDVGVTALPGRDAAALPVYGGRGLAISAYGGNLDTARDFVAWLTSQQHQERRFEVAGSGPTATALYDSAAVAGSPLGAALGAAIERARPRPEVPDYALLSQVVSDDVAAWLADGETDAAQLLVQLQERLEDVVGDR